MNRTHFAVIGMSGLVLAEIGMGLFSTADTVPDWVITISLMFVITSGSMLQVSLMKFVLTHRSRNNWRQIPGMMMQASLFVLIAYWAHKGLGNTLFVGWTDWQLWLAGLGLGLLTMFGPEIINVDYDFEEAEKPQNEQEGTVQRVEQNYATLAYKQTLVPLSEEKNGHNVDLEKAVDLIKPSQPAH